MLQVQVRFGIRAPSLLIRVFLNEVLLIKAGSHESGHKMSSNVFPKTYISKNTDVLHMFFLHKNSPYQQLSSMNSAPPKLGHLGSQRPGMDSLPCQTPVTTLGLCSRKRKLFLQIFHGLKLKHIRCCATPPWPTYWSKTHWKDLMFAFNPQRQQRQAVKSVNLQTWARTVHTSFHEGAIYFQFTIIRLRFAEWSKLLWFFVPPCPPPATQCLSQASKAHAIASATSFMTVFLDAKSFWCAEDWRYWNSLILSFSRI